MSGNIPQQQSKFLAFGSNILPEDLSTPKACVRLLYWNAGMLIEPEEQTLQDMNDAFAEDRNRKTQAEIADPQHIFCSKR